MLFVVNLSRLKLGAINMIEVEGLTKDYGRRRAVEDLSFRAERGEIMVQAKPL